MNYKWAAVRIAEWAGWLNFVDRRLLHRYNEYMKYSRTDRQSLDHYDHSDYQIEHMAHHRPDKRDLDHYDLSDYLWVFKFFSLWPIHISKIS